MSRRPASSVLEARIFLVGVPRSGTTLLQALLAAHGEVTSFTESHLFSRHFSTVPGLGPVLTADPTPRLKEFLMENGLPTPAAARWFGPPTPGLLRSQLSMPLLTRTVARRLVRVLDELGRERGAPFWLEKTPRHLHALPLLEKVCDDGVATHFVHMVRDGLQTVASLHKASRDWERAYGIEECVQRWNHDLALTVERLGSPRHHVVLYESLTTDTEAVLRELFAALGLSWEPQVLDSFRRTAGDLVASDERWKDGLAGEIRPSATAEQVLDAAQRDQVRATLRHDLYQAVAAHAMIPSPHG